MADVARAKVTVHRFGFNCPDLRNTRVVDIVSELGQYYLNVDVHDPWINVDEAHREYGIRALTKP